MKKISVWMLIMVFAVALAQAQESATQQQIDKLNGIVQDLQESQALQLKRIDALEREMSELRDKVNTPEVHEDYVTRDQLKSLANDMKEIDRKRQEDRDMIVKQIENLSKAIAAAPVAPTTTTTHHSNNTPKNSNSTEMSVTPLPIKGYEYEIKQGDNLGLIIKAYREQGVKVS
ncbi:MAG: hypothetical protein P4L61_01105, partial [Candidatus Pacebacteria bacterium]|nr:hypothetical protein [Candidatus Paceibacterota bacterium]